MKQQWLQQDPALQQAALAVNTGPQAVHLSHAVQHKSGLRAPFSCYALSAALLVVVIFLYTFEAFNGAPHLQTTKAEQLCRRTEPEKSVSASSSLSDSVAYSSSARSSAKKSCFQKSSSAPSWSSMSCTTRRKSQNSRHGAEPCQDMPEQLHLCSRRSQRHLTHTASVKAPWSKKVNVA